MREVENVKHVKKALILASVSSMIQQFNMNNITILQDMGYNVHVLANFTNGGNLTRAKSKAFQKELIARGITVFDIGISRIILKKENLDAYKSVKQIMDNEKYDIIHCHSPIGGVMARLAAKPHRKTGTKVIYTAHGFHFFKGASFKNWLIFYPIEKNLARHTDCLLTINEEDYLTSQKKNFKAGKIEWINGIGIDTKKFSKPTDKVKQHLRKIYGFVEEDFILIYIAELNANKHQDLLIDMMGRLVKDIPTVKLLLVGRGDYQKLYTEQIEKAHLEDYIHLLGYREDVEKLMALADLAVSASRREGLPVNVMEAMASGLPTVVTDCRGNRELVKNGQNGYVVGSDDSIGFAAAVEKIYQSKINRKAFGKASLTMISKYSKEQVNLQMCSIYEEMSQ